ncbi:MAG: precorrin-8X methylmutase [Pseudomonadota bacterium]
MTTLFDEYLVVDWSANSSPKTGADSIWIAHLKDGALALTNPPTRQAAEAAIARVLGDATTAGRRVLAGFDFPFGYPLGTADALAKGGWADLWDLIESVIEDGADNANNRFDAAAALNARLPGEGPFWGNGLKRDIPGLPRTRPDGYGEALPPLHRYAETQAKGAQEVWKLSGAGSVGGQALTGIPMLNRLRRQTGAAIWPFESLSEVRSHLLAEVYPSLLPPHPDEAVKDAGQVRRMVEVFAALDRAGRLSALLHDPADMPVAVRREEAAILGMRQTDAMKDAVESDKATPRPLRYERDPAAIYAASFATVRAEAKLDHLPDDLQDVAIRLVHSCGMTDVPNRLAWSEDVVASARAALSGGAPILCDCEMVKSGIIQRFLPEGVRTIATLNEETVPARAKIIGNTRSAAAVELWRDHLAGAVVVIGNAPTALFHLLELIDGGAAKPAAILGFPVGFIGAAESKAELAARPRGVPFLTLRGRRGGSAMASAALNAIAGGLG